MTDTLQPNYLTVNPDGTIGAKFSGHVAAQGLDLPAAGVGAVAPLNAVRWIRQADGAAVADTYTFDNSGDMTSVSETVAPRGDNATAVLRALGASGDPSASLRVRRGADGAADAQVLASTRVTPLGLSYTKVLLDALGQSDFVGGPVTAQTAIDFGAVTTPAPVAADPTETPLLLVPHRLGHQLASVQCTIIAGAYAQVFVPRVDVFTERDFRLVVNSPSSFGFGIGVCWLAVSSTAPAAPAPAPPPPAPPPNPDFIPPYYP